MKKAKLKQCSKCSHKVSPSARTCPNCGHPMGFLSWITENKFLLLITSIVGVNGLWFVDIIDYFSKEQTKPQVNNMQTQNPNTTRKKIRRKRKKPKKVETTPAKRKCQVCRDTKKMRCLTCKNHGRKGYLPCYNCRGQGKQRCTQCNGKGSIQQGAAIQFCNKCRGAGKQNCLTCNGTRFLRCNNCNGGYTTCNSCY